MAAAPRNYLLILDCDGVLVRSETANVAYYNHLFETFGLPPVTGEQQREIHLLHTLSTPQVIDRFLPAELRAPAHAYAQRLEYARFLPLLEAEPGWSAVLERWRKTGRVAVATNRGRSAQAVLGAVGLLHQVDLVVTIQDVARPKPHPDLLLKVLDHFQIAPAAALYVGDSQLDCEAAAGAGVAFLGFRRAEPPSVASAAELGELLDTFARQPPSGRLQVAVGGSSID